MAYNSKLALSGDLSGSNIAGTVIKIQGNPVINTSLGSTQDGYVLTWHNASTQAQWLPVSSGGSVTWANDLVNSTSTNQYVSSLSYSSASAGGTITINGTATALQVAANNTAFKISQATQTSDIATSDITISPQPPYASASSNPIPGNLTVNFGVNPQGTKGGGLKLQRNGTTAMMLGTLPGGGANCPIIWFGTTATTFSTINTNYIGIDNGNSRMNINIGNIAVDGLSTISSLQLSYQGSQFITIGNYGGWGEFVRFGAGLSFGTQSQTANYTIKQTNSGAGADYIVFVDTTVAGAGKTITLPSSPHSGESYEIKDSTGSAATYNITISGNGKNIDGHSTFVMATNYQHIRLVYNGVGGTTQWQVM